MKRCYPLLTLFIFISTLSVAQEQFYTQEWSKVYKFEIKDLPESALKVVEPIYQRAKKENNYAQIIKALIYKSKFILKDDSADVKIVDQWRQEISISPAPLKNILQSLLAEIYKEYWMVNQWKIYNRTRVNDLSTNDFTEWDANTFHLRITTLYLESLQKEELLQKISLDKFEDILLKAEGSSNYRPTLYDFLSHNAIDYFQQGNIENFDFKPGVDLNNVNYVNNPLLIEIPNDSTTAIEKAIKIYQSLIKFHGNNRDISAYVQLKIEWINFLTQEVVFPDVTQLKIKAFDAIAIQYNDHPASAMARFEEANLIFQNSKDSKDKTRYLKKEALQICDEVLTRFPLSDGSKKCQLLKNEITKSNLSAVCEKFIAENTYSRIKVDYQNIDSVYISIYKISLGEINHHFDYQNFNPSFLKKRSPVYQSSYKLNNPSDYEEHSTELSLPPLNSAIYLIRLSTSKNFTDSSTFCYSYFTVTNQALVEANYEDFVRYQVVDRNSGQPLRDIDLRFNSINTDNSRTQLHEVYKTDKNGFVEIKKKSDFDPYFEITTIINGDTISFSDFSIYSKYNYDTKEKEYITAKPFVFTDRAIYRPGQTVYFKGILIKEKSGKSSVVTGQYVEIFLNDASGNEVDYKRLKTNQYGSFSGEFTLPLSGVLGEYNISVEDDLEEDSRFYDKLDDFDYNECYFSVEEYKRPTFEVKFNAVKETFQLQDTVKITGNVSTFSGSNIVKGKVKYHVVRNIRFPSWYYWARNRYYPGEQEIVSGETVTDTDGKFLINFAAIPDETISKNDYPVFTYEITADVTDINGETRSATSTVKIGYHTIQGEINVDDKLSRKNANAEVIFKVVNLNGEEVDAVGRLKVFKKKYASEPQRERPWDAPDLPLISKDEFEKLFPHDKYDGEDTGEMLMFDQSINTAESKNITLPVNKNWPLGEYLVTLDLQDKNDMVVTEKSRFILFDDLDKGVYDHQLFTFETDKTSYKVGDVARITLGSASKDISFTIDVETNDKVIKTHIISISEGVKDIYVPITEEFAKGIIVNAYGVNYNSFIEKKKQIPIYEEQNSIEIETISFKDKIDPGGKELWSFQIKGNNKQMVEAEMLASMYDASLDQFREHHWDFLPKQRDYFYGYSRINAYQSFGFKSFHVNNIPNVYYEYPRQHFDDIDWFGFSISNNYYIKNQYLSRLYSSGISGNDETKISKSNNKNLKKGFVTGRITSVEDGSPLPAVNVLVKGTTRGTITDAEGRFLIKADRGEVLVFTFIGLVTTEVDVTNKNVIDVGMAADVTQLSEVIVTALGVPVEKKSLSYSVATIATDTTASDAVLVLNGKAAGIQIAGLPGGTMQVAIRGMSTLTEANKPLYVVDGVIVNSMVIEQNDIANVQVLKGASATSLYGAQATNGVIIISTISGQKKLDEAMAKINARKNFNETAFFFPHLTTDSNGKIKFSFTTPESLTRWKLQLLAHTKDLQSASKVLQTITQKNIMITPNVPRFIRVGDEFFFSVKVSNLTSNKYTGSASLQLLNPADGTSADSQFDNVLKSQSFTIKEKGSTDIVWRLKAPDGMEVVQYKVVAKAGNFSDGEQALIPILSNRILVTEAMPMNIRANQISNFAFKKLKQENSSTLKHHQFTLEVSTNPLWYAIQALPYLIEFPYECAEQTFSRYYANTIGSYLINSNPNIKSVMSEWKGKEQMVSQLEKNSELKSVLLQESPWFRDAQNETDQKARMALMFDEKHLADQATLTLQKLTDMQLHNGGFPWFKGSDMANQYITQHIATGFAHLQHLHVPLPEQATMIQKNAISYLDDIIAVNYKRLIDEASKIATQKGTVQNQLKNEYLNKNHLSYNLIHYLYMRSFTPDTTLSVKQKSIIDFYVNQTGIFWKQYNVYMKGMIALIQSRNGNQHLAKDILLSLKEQSNIDDDLGMYWVEEGPSWYWFNSPVETQTLLIEAFNEINWTSTEEKLKIVDALRMGLLKHKQTHQWKSTKATTEAIFSLMKTGNDWASSNKDIGITVAGKPLEIPDNAEVATGHFKKVWKEEEVKSNLSDIQFTNNNKSSAWAAAYWQYFEDIDKIKSANTSVSLNKKVYKVLRDANGEVLQNLNERMPIVTGDLIRIRLTLTVDRYLEFLHLKDLRAAGLEPVEVLSQYKYSEGLSYYQSTRDASTNFFFDEVGPGTYVFEYDLRASVKGEFSNGMASIQCMYAPEFVSHSDGTTIKIE